MAIAKLEISENLQKPRKGKVVAAGREGLWPRSEDAAGKADTETGLNSSAHPKGTGADAYDCRKNAELLNQSYFLG